MASMGTSEMIFFIATMIVTASVVGVLGGQTLHITQSMGQSSKSVSSMIQSSFEIINDPSNIPYSNGYVFYVKNTGNNQLDFTNNTVSTTIDGTLITGSIITYQASGNSGVLYPAQVGDIIVQMALTPGYHTITVTLNNGVSHQMVFQI